LSSGQDLLDLVDWRRRVGDLYRLRGPGALEEFRRGRDQLFRTHPQSPIEDRPEFAGLDYFPGDPAYRVDAAFEPSADGGPAIAQSTFHHFADYNWNPQRGAPSFVAEPPGDALAHSPEAQRSIERYVRNLALWLAGRPVDTAVAE